MCFLIQFLFYIDNTELSFLTTSENCPTGGPPVPSGRAFTRGAIQAALTFPVGLQPRGEKEEEEEQQGQPNPLLL